MNGSKSGRLAGPAAVRAVLRLFDCVQCGACRIHGKVAWFGVATALKLIYSDGLHKATLSGGSGCSC